MDSVVEAVRPDRKCDNQEETVVPQSRSMVSSRAFSTSSNTLTGGTLDNICGYICCYDRKGIAIGI
jgi:hypothetical protein